MFRRESGTSTLFGELFGERTMVPGTVELVLAGCDASGVGHIWFGRYWVRRKHGTCFDAEGFNFTSKSICGNREFSRA